MTAAGEGEEILHEILIDYLIKGAVVVTALLVLVVVLTVVYRRAGR